LPFFFFCDDNKKNIEYSARSPDKVVNEVCLISSPFLIANIKEPIKQKDTILYYQTAAWHNNFPSPLHDFLS